MSGARHSNEDQTHLDQAVNHLLQAGANAPQGGDEPARPDWIPDKALVFSGAEAKALGDGLVGGYLVRYSDQTKTDLTGDFFNSLSDTGPAEQSDAYYHHGLDKTLGKSPLKNKASIGKDDVGVWIKHQLDLRNEYEKAIYGLAEQKKLGWSSGTAAHLVERERVGNAMWIKRWPLGLDASYTPTPAEPRNAAITLKAYVDSLQPAEQPAPNGAQEPSTAPISAVVQPKQEIKKMGTETEVREMPADMKAVMDQILAGVTNIGKRVAALENEPAVHEGGVADGGKTAEMLAAGKAPGVKTIQETYAQEQVAALKEYLHSEIGDKTAKDAWKAHNTEIGKRDAGLNQAFKNLTHSLQDGGRAEAAYRDAMKASMVEGTASLGGNLVPQLYGNRLVGKLKEASIVRQSGAYQFPVSGGYKFQVPTITRSGSAPIAAELGAASQMEPTFSTVDFTAYAYRAQYIASREQVLDSRIPLDEILMDNAAWQFTQSENNHFAIGSGSSQPDGIAHAASVIAASPGSTLAIAFASASGSDNVYDLYHSLPYQYRDGAVWFANDLTIKAIRKIRTGGGGAASLGDYFWQAGGANGVPDRLLGKPIYPLNNMYTSGSAAGSLQGALVIANMDFFWIADFYNGGLDFQVLNELYAASAAIGWWFWKRMDSHLVVSEAAQALALR